MNARILSLAGAALIAGVVDSSAYAHRIEAPLTADHPAFDIHHADIVRKDTTLELTMHFEGRPGTETPDSHGQLAGAPVWSYVWPTTIDTSVIGFDAGAGILSFAVTSHPDFDDTPLFDEDGDGDPENDGRRWHSHWVVLVPDDSCGQGGLKVRDIPEGATPSLPKTWPGLPILIDSPGWHPRFTQDSLVVTVPFDAQADLKGINFDAVTAALQVNASVHDPLLCVTDVFEAAGGLKMPGMID
ncbi:MAG: hypothetical protein CMO05_09005 [Thalassospira sp.]|uniref:hypothetical protein n=1 Tax=Thalassospira sp. GB04J01 TaxID=1485225 RepID=UPI000C0D3CF6|nr:hypothetical protein [Thalassospira sp. GB04J01]MBV17595.1 hypothetical protein [Thalassospira sp.]|tara:strand:- start:54422 stop:55150 length:729 start_codon:yes stop_codon:yes gene_type:complete